VTHPVEHLDDDLLSALVDEQLTPQQHSQVNAHLSTCAECQDRLEEFRSVKALLRVLPDVPPPRDFVLGPRAVADPPNVIRLRRWYTVARASAASLAAVFVLLSGGALYLDSRPAAAPAAQLAEPRIASAPAPAAQSAPAAGSAAAPTAVARPAAPAAGAAAARPAIASPQPDDQVAAATSVSPLPTSVPTPQPTAVVPRILQPVASSAPDAGAPLRNGAMAAGILAVVAILAALAVRHRLRTQQLHL
jgi:hypothetical protein